MLNRVTAPGCVEFGYKAFAERSSLQWVHASEGVANQFCSSTKFGHYLFRDCVNLATFVLQEISHQQDPQAGVEAKELSQGCLSSTGRTTLELTRDFQVLGAHACDNCKLLKKVDVSNTKIAEIQEFTFVHCASLCEIKLPYTLHTIRAKAFMNCAALPEIAIPPSLHYIASRAFLDCTALGAAGVHLTLWSKNTSRRELSTLHRRRRFRFATGVQYCYGSHIDARVKKIVA